MAGKLTQARDLSEAEQQAAAEMLGASLAPQQPGSDERRETPPYGTPMGAAAWPAPDTSGCTCRKDWVLRESVFGSAVHERVIVEHNPACARHGGIGPKAWNAAIEDLLARWRNSGALISPPKAIEFIHIQQVS